MDPIRSSLASGNLALLQSVVERREPALVTLIDDLGQRSLVDSDREALRHVVLSEFLDRGLGADDEPTPYGLELEDLIDILGNC